MPEEDNTLTDSLPLPDGMLYKNIKTGYEYYLMWEADGVADSHESEMLFKILVNDDGDFFVINTAQFTSDFEAVTIETHPQYSLL